MFDAHPNILGWASEAIKIPYEIPEIRNGIAIKRQTFYIPDFFIVYIDRNHVQHKELIEIKPKDEMPFFQGKVNTLKQARQAMNFLKWQAALRFCAARNWKFRVVTEDQLFAKRG
jgi:hypothetical protein